MTRDKRIDLRASREELALLRQRASQAGMTLGRYLREIGLHGRVQSRNNTAEIQTIHKLLKEINPIGNNLDQIAARLNAGLPILPGEADELKKLLQQNTTLCREIKNQIREHFK